MPFLGRVKYQLDVLSDLSPLYSEWPVLLPSCVPIVCLNMVWTLATLTLTLLKVTFPIPVINALCPIFSDPFLSPRCRLTDKAPASKKEYVFYALSCAVFAYSVLGSKRVKLEPAKSDLLGSPPRISFATKGKKIVRSMILIDIRALYVGSSDIEEGNDTKTWLTRLSASTNYSS